jgi:hypothetical protein
MTPLQPILFLLGPSGVGKSWVAKGLREDYSFLHIEIEPGFKRNGFPTEWDENIGNIDFASLATAVRRRLNPEQRGAALSLRAEHVFTIQQLTTASRAGISPVVLWGTKESCLDARRVRQTQRLGRFDAGDLKRYWQQNILTFATYARPEFDEFRVEAFQADGVRWPREYMFALVVARANQPTMN